MKGVSLAKIHRIGTVTQLGFVGILSFHRCWNDFYHKVKFADRILSSVEFYATSQLRNKNAVNFLDTIKCAHDKRVTNSHAMSATMLKSW